ncbi:MAG TPA: hypothetical protein VK828_00605 [Terriglobales bacterium]|jgi:hypothetical protein|nr:hypothetical protein [Terriglobales bacterium]
MPQLSESLSGRPLRQEERDLILPLLSEVYDSIELEKILADSRVTDMQDGGMGSLQFGVREHRSFGKVVAKARYVDSDGVLVSIVINTDREGKLFELDFWKVDFSRLKRYPTDSDLLIEH